MFHVYVDPIYGDNTIARQRNPTAATALAVHPNATFRAQRNPGILHHAPYSFRTISNTAQTFGALDYIINTFLPLPRSLNGNRITHIVMHCLPGIYGRGTAIDPRSGLRFNDEQFPIPLPDRVSIQGTSALDTIFDAQEDATNIIEVRATSPVITHRESFIDGITIRRARGLVGTQRGAGIFIGDEGNVYVRISNCFITNNLIGIAINNDHDVTRFVHSPIIVNNTIAWNQVGIWSGDLNPQQTSIGWAKPRILNNIIDSKNRFFPTNTPTSCFEGVHIHDVTVVRLGTMVFPNLDMNAWESGRAQLGVIPLGWIATAPRSGQGFGSTPPTTPRFDIGPYTHAGTTAAHGSLFINDIFRNYLATTGIFVPDSPHDFRLAPLVSTSASAPPPPNSLNPLVNLGVDLSLGTILMGNGQQPEVGLLAPPITSPPGLNVAIPPNSPMHAWDWDTEGFGNPRITLRSGWAPGQFSNIDLGADEMGLLLMAGWINGTRVFSRNVPGASLISDHTGVYFFETGPVGVTYPRPFYTTWVGQHSGWWTWVQSNPFWASGNYTTGVPNSLRAGLVTSLGPFMRNFECDISPHLILDFHPAWGLAWFGNDGFAANPWYHNSPIWMYDNYNLYYATSGPFPGAVLDGTIDPPGSWLWTTGSGYLFPGQQTFQFGPFGYAGKNTFTVNAWGFGDIPPGPDIIPDTVGLGVRFTCSLTPPASAASDNIQTFLGVNTAAAYSEKSGRRAVKLPVTKVAPMSIGQIEGIRKAALRQR